MVNLTPNTTNNLRIRIWGFFCTKVYLFILYYALLSQTFEHLHIITLENTKLLSMELMVRKGSEGDFYVRPGRGVDLMPSVDFS